MEKENKLNILCSSIEHEKSNAISFCGKCRIYMCNKCEILHSKLLKNHQIFILENNFQEIFTGYCNEENHDMELEYLCKTHNKLCCAACLSKIKKNKNGEHKDCDVCLIEDIKEEKLNKLKENISNLENLSKTIEQLINEIKVFSEKIKNDKEELKNKIQNMFTKLRNELNNREEQLLFEVDKRYNEIYFNEDFIKNIEKLPNKIKLSLEKGKKLDNEHKENKLKLNLLIDECIRIENNIKDINIINEKIKKCNNSINLKMKFNLETEQGIKNFIKIIKSFGFCPIKIKDYKLKKSINLNSGICSIIILDNQDIAVGKRNGELVIFDSTDLKEIVKVQAH